MRIAIINDTHFGARNDSALFLEHFVAFFENQFFPYVIKNNIKTIFHLGDLLDRRKYVNFHTLSVVQDKFIKRIKELDLEMYCVIGNHDTYFRNTNNINSVQELFGDSIHIIQEPKELVMPDGVTFLALPWVNSENYDTTVDAIKKSTSEYVIGHLEISGFQVIRGVTHDEGLDKNLFSKFDTVFSGHFHCKQSDKNIQYLGTQYQITFNDLNEVKGFHVFDTDTRELEYIRNPVKLFSQIRYDDVNYDMMETEFSKFNKTFVRLVVQTKKKPVSFDNFIQALYDAGAYDISITEDHAEQDEQTSAIDDISRDTLSLIHDEIDKMEDIENLPKLKKMIHELYLESLTVEE